MLYTVQTLLWFPEMIKHFAFRDQKRTKQKTIIKISWNIKFLHMAKALNKITCLWAFTAPPIDHIIVGRYRHSSHWLCVFRLNEISKKHTTAIPYWILKLRIYSSIIISLLLSLSLCALWMHLSNSTVVDEGAALTITFSKHQLTCNIPQFDIQNVHTYHDLWHNFDNTAINYSICSAK